MVAFHLYIGTYDNYLILSISICISTCIFRALQSNGIAGAGGILFGGTVSIFRASPTPALFAAVAGIQWALLGGTFYGFRSAFLASRDPSTITQSTFTTASTIAGSLSFATVGALTRGRANILPGALIGGIAGWSGQGVYNYYDKQHTTSLDPDAPPQQSIIDRITKSKYFPMRKLSDDEYQGMLEEKLLRVKANIAVLDDDLAALKGKQSRPNETLERNVEEQKLSAKVINDEEWKKLKRREG